MTRLFNFGHIINLTMTLPDILLCNENIFTSFKQYTGGGQINRNNLKNEQNII